MDMAFISLLFPHPMFSLLVLVLQNKIEVFPLNMLSIAPAIHMFGDSHWFCFVFSPLFQKDRTRLRGVGLVFSEK